MSSAKPRPDRPSTNNGTSGRYPSFTDVTLGLILALPLLLLVALVLIFPERAQYVVDLGEALAWPLAVLLAVIAFRAVIPDLVGGIGGRIKGISIPPLTLELVTVTEVEPTWTVLAPAPMDVRGPTPAHIFDAPTGALFEQLSDAAADYAVIDLGTGEEWVTSRLFIFSVVLQALRGLRCFVFVETTVAGRGQFVGIATPDNVRRLLGGLYPWFERALGAAYGFVSMQLPTSASSPPTIGMQSWFARDLVRAFLDHPEIQHSKVKPREVWPPPGEEWLLVEQPGTPLWEHGGWIGGDRLIKDLGPILNREAWVTEQDGDRTALERAIIGREGPFVGVIGNGWRFHRLVDRIALLERVSAQLETSA